MTGICSDVSIRFLSFYPFSLEAECTVTDNINITSEDSSTIAEMLHAKDFFFRVDHQTFRKLPRSQGIIFGV